MSMFLFRGRGKLEEEASFIITTDDISSCSDSLVASVGSGEMQCAMMMLLCFLIMVLLCSRRNIVVEEAGLV